MSNRSRGGQRFCCSGTSRPATFIIEAQRPASSPTLKEIIVLGAAAVPTLIAHLDDQRPTNITIKRKFYDAMSFNDEYS